MLEKETDLFLLFRKIATEEQEHQAKIVSSYSYSALQGFMKMCIKNYEKRNERVTNMIRLFSELTDEERLKVMQQFCRSCGSNNPNCQCWNDE